MTASEDALAGMSDEQYAQFSQLPADLRLAYTQWFKARKERRAAHRDTLEAFVAGWHMATGRAARRLRKT